MTGSRGAGDDNSFEGYAIEAEWRRLGLGECSRKYISLIRCDPDRPSYTICSIGGGRGVAGVTHPYEPRKFTIPELRIVSGFPADYALAGTYAKQWARLGNAVPPLMMHAIAATLRDGLFTRIGRTRAGFRDAVFQDESTMTKPPFRIPSMQEVAAARGTTGLSVVSTFSGCGGSCLGFEMAGYRVLWANEFLPIARESYAANHPETVLDGRDIRRVEPQQILDAIGLQPGELDVFNGSPPCQAFSTVGQRNEGWGKLRDYGNGVQQKNEDLFFEYVRLLKGLQPRAFIAENVAGLTRGFALGYFKQIMRALDAAGYAVRCKILDAQWLGVPQTRQRAIFVGVRRDLELEPEFPKPRAYHYTLRDVLPGLQKVEQVSRGFFTQAGDVTDRPCPCPAIVAQGTRELHIYERDIALSPELERQWADRELRQSRQFGDSQRLICPAPGQPAPAILTSSAMLAHPTEPRRFTIDECKLVCSFPADYVLKGSYAKQWARLGNAVPPMMMREIAGVLRDGLFAKLGRTRAGFTEAR